MKRLLAFMLTFSLATAALSGCGRQEAVQQPTGNGPQNRTLVVGTLNFDGKFSPFFYTNAYENDVLSLVHVSLLGTDREGAVVLRGIEGEVRPYNGTDYTYTGIADCVITENPDGTVFYDITLKEGVRFSDGELMDIDDVIFSLYVPLDPTYDGNMTLYSMPIEGLEAYRSGVQTLQELILAAGPEGYAETEHYTREQYEAFWEAFRRAEEKFSPEEQKDYGALAADEGFLTQLETELGDAAYQTGIETGVSAPNISGIQKTGDMSLRIVLTEVSATAVYQLATAVVPMHYYGDEALYDYENNMFGFPKGDLSGVKAVTTAPRGAGPYAFQSFQNGVVTLEANSLYYKGEPKITTIQFREGLDADKVPGVAAGTIDIADPAYSVETAKAIAQLNGGKLSGDVITSVMTPYPGYGYIGFNSSLVNVGGENGSEASKNLRKAIATVIAVYRDVAVDSYYGEFANVINYPISDTSWAAPRVTDEGYRLAFSVDTAGRSIYTNRMNAEKRYEAALAAALGFFEAAGYTVQNGYLTAAPQGASLSYEVLVGAGGTGDHPTFMALTQAAAALKTIGFDLIVTDISNFSELTGAVNAGTAEMFAMAWNATADPDMFQVYHSRGGSNEKAYHIKDARLDELILMARQSTDQAYRKTLYKACLEIIADWAVEIPMYQRQNVTIISSQRVNRDTLTPDITAFWGWENDIEKLEMR